MHLPVSRKNQDTKELLAEQNNILQKAVVTHRVRMNCGMQKRGRGESADPLWFINQIRR